MKVLKLLTNPKIYSGNSFLLLGSWNKLNDVNTVVDTGSDSYIINQIEKINTGVGKKPVDQIVLTHSHFDHIGGIMNLKEKFGAQVLAFSRFPGVDRVICSGETLLMGDCYFEVIHTPGHSSDSICLYCKSEKILFSGDTSLRIIVPDIFYTDDYIDSIRELSRLQIRIVYPGHGDEIIENPEEMIKNSLLTMETGRKIVKGNQGQNLTY
jgi:glyoxylase-like metal-dependent hydrolase (beta-lactamase superfamily II)